MVSIFHQITFEPYFILSSVGFEVYCVYRNVYLSVMSVSLKDKSQYHEYGIYETAKP